MKRLFLLVFCLAQALISHTQALPLVKNGQWSLIDTNGRLITETPYEYIETFDQSGTTFYQKNALYGILDLRGKELTPAVYTDIQNFGFGVYSVKQQDRWTLIQVLPELRTIRDSLLEVPTVISSNWIQLTDRKTQSSQLFCVQSNKLLPLDNNTHIIDQAYDYLYLNTRDSVFEVLDPAGNSMGKDPGMFLYQNDGVLEIRDTIRVLLYRDSNGPWPFQQNIISVEAFYDKLIVTSERDVVIYHAQTRQRIFGGNFQSISYLDTNYYLVKRFDNLSNLVSIKTQKPLFSYKYASIWRYGDLFEVKLPNGNLGLIDKNGNELIMGVYTYFNKDGDFIYTHLNKSNGLYSLKTKKTLVPCAFNRITLSNNLIKAFGDKVIMAVKINDKHQVLNELYSENPVVIRTQEYKVPDSRESFYIDPRLLSLGWFVDSTLVDVPGKPSKMTYTWGLKSPSDSVLITPRFKQLKYAFGPYTFNVNSMTSFGKSRNISYEMRPKQAIYLDKGKVIGKNNILDIDTLDFLNRSFMRGATSKGFIILSDSGTIKDVDFVEIGQAKILRFCEKGEAKVIDPFLTPNLKEVVPFNTKHFFKTQLRNFGEKVHLNSRYSIQYEKAEWNYLLPDGEKLHPEPLEFAFAFVGNHGICKKKGKWGVLSPDSVLVPFVYDNIDRIIKGKDTFFVCRKNQAGFHLLDTMLRPIAEAQAFVKSVKSLTLVSNGRMQRMINNHYQPVDSLRSQWKLFDNGYSAYKQKKQWIVLDQGGNYVGETTLKIDEFLTDEHFIFHEGVTLGIASILQDSVPDAVYKSVKRTGPFIQLEKGGAKKLLDLNLKQVFSWEGGNILVDSVSGNFVHSNGNMLTVYQPSGKKVKKLKLGIPDHFVNGGFIFGGKTTRIYKADGTFLYQFDPIVKIRSFEDHYLAIKTDSAGWLVFDSNWKQIRLSAEKVKYLNYHGRQVFSFQGKQDLYSIKNLESGKQLDGFSHVGGSITEGALLAQRNNRRYFYIDEQLSSESASTYAHARPFQNGLAVVNDPRGWTLINTHFRPVSFPGFGEIKALSPTIYAAPRKPLVTLISSKGEELIPLAYEQFKFISNQLVQCIFGGEISYYKIPGGKLGY